MRWILSLLALLSVWMAIPTFAQEVPNLRFVPICERVPEGWPGECLPLAAHERKEFTIAANHIMRRVPFVCDWGVIDPTLPATRFNLVLLSCPAMTLSGLVEVEP